MVWDVGDVGFLRRPYWLPNSFVGIALRFLVSEISENISVSKKKLRDVSMRPERDIHPRGRRRDRGRKYDDGNTRQLDLPKTVVHHTSLSTRNSISPKVSARCVPEMPYGRPQKQTRAHIPGTFGPRSWRRELPRAPHRGRRDAGFIILLFLPRTRLDDPEACRNRQHRNKSNGRFSVSLLSVSCDLSFLVRLDTLCNIVKAFTLSSGIQNTVTKLILRPGKWSRRIRREA